MGRKYEYIHKRRKIGEEILEEKTEEPIDIDTISDEELGKLVKSGIIKWHDIKRWSEKKQTKN